MPVYALLAHDPGSADRLFAAPALAGLAAPDPPSGRG
jgi:hypothetical protein